MDFNNLPDVSSISGDTVTTEGIVTAIDSNGFYLQDATGDGDIATSDALFVFTGSSPGVDIGDELEVSGTVSEFFPGGTDTRNLPTTQIGGNPTIALISSNNALPTPQILGRGGRVPPSENIDDDAFGSFDPETDGIDFFESLEAMRVTAQDAVAVAGTNRFGEIFTVVDNGVDATGISDRGTLNISPDDFNPEKVQIDEDSGVFNFDFPSVNVGDFLGDVTGVVGYSFGNFEILPTEDFTSNIVSNGLQPETSSLAGGEDAIAIASYNVLNLDPNDNDGDTDVADGRFEAIAQQIVDNSNAPEIVSLQEVQDNSGSVDDGTVAADETLQTLIEAIANAGGPTYQFIDNTFIGDGLSGGQPGGNIRTAFLYDSDRVSLVDGSVRTIGSQAPGEVFAGARLPLVATFEFQGEDVTVVNNHFSSKGGSAPILGTEQPFEARQEDVTVNGSLDERQAQSQAVQSFASDLLSADSDANLVVLGDLNEFEFVSPVTGLESVGLTNLVNTLDEDERYSFIFQGNSQELDHILVSDSLANGAEFDIVRVNSEFAETPQRASDHEPLLVQLEIAATDGGDGDDSVEEQPPVSDGDESGESGSQGGNANDESGESGSAGGSVGENDDEESGFETGSVGETDDEESGSETGSVGESEESGESGSAAGSVSESDDRDLGTVENSTPEIVSGTDGSDWLTGTDDGDIIVGGRGGDVLTGGDGGDTFVYTDEFDSGDLITDFTPGEDVIDFSQLLETTGLTFDDFGFWEVSSGTLITLEGTESSRPLAFVLDVSAAELSDIANFEV
ncbi:Alkaline phosphatase [Geitlerinema sp. FC II]|nr:Alkaline phosphatase [Geitlerinema sp. FC II]